MVMRTMCPQGGPPQDKRNRHVRSGEPYPQCKAYGRHFVECFEHYLIAENIPALIERVRLERISLRGICPTVGVGLKWLLGFLGQYFKALPELWYVQPRIGHGNVLIRPLVVEADGMSSFMREQANQQWIWMAMDAETLQVMAFAVGDGSRRSAKRLWAKILRTWRAGHCQVNGQSGRMGLSSEALRSFRGHFITPSGAPEPQNPPQYPQSGRDFIAHR
jgi:insertion element IS1 protein InsB